ncbi:HAMP domain-containing sensor histidine kinase [Pelagicoccus sp. SDUM812002]|nr:HAMP domain-containing sensor histidine kinase [Pelagicoccus sp. SDUM812002]
MSRIKTKHTLDWVGFGCVAWLIVQVEFGHYLKLGSFEAMVAWDVFILFLLYLALPISLVFQVVLALILSVTSLSIWISGLGDLYFGVEYVGVTSVYIGANFFGFVCSVHNERTAREEFGLLENEKRLKADLESAFSRLESTIESRNQIFSILAHDLRGTMGGLDSVGKLLSEEDSKCEVERQELLDLLCLGTKASYDLLEDLLQWALAENERFQSEPEDVSLSAAVSRSMELTAVVARNKGIELSSSIDEALMVHVDPKMLDTVIRNLISNAIKFTHSGGSVRVASAEVEEGFVEVSVSDTGVGIDEGRLSRLFQLSPSESSKGTAGELGTSLGLRVCGDFVAKLGGRISVSSEVGIGTCFTVTLPSMRLTV